MKKSRARSHFFVVFVDVCRFVESIFNIFVAIDEISPVCRHWRCRQIMMKVFVSVLRFETDKSDAVIDGSRGIQEARREWAVELVGVGLR